MFAKEGSNKHFFKCFPILQRKNMLYVDSNTMLSNLLSVDSK